MATSTFRMPLSLELTGIRRRLETYVDRHRKPRVIKTGQIKRHVSNLHRQTQLVLEKRTSYLPYSAKL
jgi:hypothetical protein